MTVLRKSEAVKIGELRMSENKTPHHEARKRQEQG